MKPSVYIETTIISYLTAKPSRDLIVAAHQQITNEWWSDVRPQVDCYVSPFLIDEASRGDRGLPSERLLFKNMNSLISLDYSIATFEI